jgi:hypothetical protein
VRGGAQVLQRLRSAPRQRLPDLRGGEPTGVEVLRRAHSALVSFHLQSDPCGDHSLIIEGTAVIDATIPALDAHERYRAKTVWTSPGNSRGRGRSSLDCRSFALIVTALESSAGGGPGQDRGYAAGGAASGSPISRGRAVKPT